MTSTPEQTGTAERTRAVAEDADRLTQATTTGVPCQPVRDLLGETDLDLAYAVQRRFIDTRLQAGGRLVGRKIGLTSRAVQQQLSVDRPDFGILLEDMDVSGQGAVPVDQLLQPKAEAELAFVLVADLDSPDLDLDAVRATVDYAVAAIEIVDSRVADWDITITDTVAEHGSSGLFLLGEKRVPLSEFEPVEVTPCRCSPTARSSSEGNGGAACLGDPSTPHCGWPGPPATSATHSALGPMRPVTPGMSVSAEIPSLGSVRATFADKDES